MFRCHSTNVMKNGGSASEQKKNKKYCTYLDHMVETALFQKLFESSENCVEKKMKFEWRYLRYKFNPNESKLEAIPTGIDRWKGEMYKFEINYI